MTDARPPGAAGADPPPRSVRIVLWAMLAITAASGLGLMPFRDMDLLYLARLRVHVAAGALAFILSVPLYLQHVGGLLGWSSILGRQIVYLALVAFPPPMAAGPAVALLAADAILLEWRLRRQTRDAARRREARASFAGFGLLYLSFLTGRHLLQNPFPGVVYLHWVHGPAVLACATWLGARRIARVEPPRRRAVATAGLAVSALAFAVLFTWRHFLRTGEADPRRPEVYRTVESILERPRLEPAPASMLRGSEGCDGARCHPEIVEQWRGSAHRFAVNNRFFKKEVALFVEMEGKRHLRICINCHDPVAAFSPDAEERFASGQIDNPEGISCTGCHSVTAFDAERGNGLYAVRAPYAYPFDGQGGRPSDPRLHAETILTDSGPHIRSFRRKRLYRKGESCVACHLVTVPGDLRDGEPLRLHTLFDQWRESPWRDVANCVDCHMPRHEPNASGYFFFDHRIAGIATDLPLNAEVWPSDVPRVESYATFTERYIAGAVGEGDPYREPPKARTEDRLRDGPPAGSPIHLDSEKLLAGPILSLEILSLRVESQEGRVVVRTRTANRRVGHNFPSGLIDVQEAWLEAILEDRAGSTLAHVGSLDEAGLVDPTAPILGSRGIVDGQGRPLERHEFWKTARSIDRRVLAPFDAVEDEIALPLPKRMDGDFAVTVRWNFRRMNQRIARWVWDGNPPSLPILVLVSEKRRFAIEPGPEGSLRVVVARAPGGG